MTEEGAYRRLLDWSYAHERPLPLLMRDVNRIGRANSPAERRAVARVLSEFFELMEDGWHNGRVDRELAKFQNRLPVTSLKRSAVAERSARSRARRAAMFEALAQVGVTCAFNTPNATLADLCTEHRVTLPSQVAPRVAPRVATDGDTGSQAPNTNPQYSATGALIEPGSETEARARASRAVRKAGLASVNPADPRFAALIKAGCTDEELAQVAAEAAAKGKGWAWFLATVKGRREDAAAPVPHGAPQTARQRADAETLGAWVPQLAPKRLNEA